MTSENSHDIAIVGIGCRFPGARNVSEYGRLLARPQPQFRAVPDSRWRHGAFAGIDPRDPYSAYTGTMAMLDDVGMFDTGYYKIPPQRARFMDPQHRLLIDLTREALQDAGWESGGFNRTETAVIMALAESGYREITSVNIRLRQISGGEFGEALAGEEWLRAGNAIRGFPGTGIAGVLQSMGPASISSVFDLHGVSHAVDAACSGGLVAVAEAVHSLRAGRCEVALAGGAQLVLVPDLLLGLCRIGALSPTDTCRPFDSRADGAVLGEGGAVLVLRRLAEARAAGDRVYAVIRGVGLSNDGTVMGGLTPRADGQLLALRRAYADAGLAPGAVGYLESHGTGTTIGDQAEIDALWELRKEESTRAYLGAVKAVVGHSLGTAGLAGLIKTALMVRDGVIFPQPDFRPSDQLSVAEAGLDIPVEFSDWPEPGQPRRAGVSAFGFGGTNAHVVLEEDTAAPAAPETGGPELLTLSARDRQGLIRHAREIAETLALDGVPLGAAAATLARRAALPRRLAVVADTEMDAVGKLVTAALSLEAGRDRDLAPGTVAGRVPPGEEEEVVLAAPGGESALRELAGRAVSGKGLRLLPVRRPVRTLPPSPLSPRWMWIVDRPKDEPAAGPAFVPKPRVTPAPAGHLPPPGTLATAPASTTSDPGAAPARVPVPPSAHLAPSASQVPPTSPPPRTPSPQPPNPPIGPPAPPISPPPPAGGGDDVLAIVVEEVARISAFPAADLSPSQILEADLGFDSLMATDLEASLARRLPGMPPGTVIRRELTIREVAGLAAGTPTPALAVSAPASPANAVAPSAATPSATTPSATTPSAATPPAATSPAATSSAAPLLPGLAWDAASARVDDFPEVAELEGRLGLLAEQGVANPYFRVHQGNLRDVTKIDDREYVSFSGYNYLGLSGHPVVTQAAREAMERYGTSVSASRLLAGERPLTRDLERELAALLRTEDALALVSGHATNVTVIGHVAGPDDLIVHDSLAHDSILQGCALSGATRRPFAHNDVGQLEDILRRTRARFRRVLIVTEGAYSMDGDLVDLPRVAELKCRFGALLLVDEAHSIGTVGAMGGGVGEYFDVDRSCADFWMGTLSKSLASCGGYLAGSARAIRWLRYTLPGFVYSVGMTPANAAAALAAIELMRSEPQRLRRLAGNAAAFLSLAHAEGIATGTAGHTPIVPCLVGDSARTLRLADRLFEQGIVVDPILHPAVDERLARLRFFVTSEHTDAAIRRTVATLARESRALA